MIKMNNQTSANSLKSEPFLWIHLAGIAAVPIFLQIVWLGLAVGQPLVPFWLELLLLVGVGIVPIFWMQWIRPFDIFSLLLLALEPNKLTPSQQKILTLFKLPQQRILTAIAAVLMLVKLWFIYQWAPLASTIVTFLPQWRILGLLIAAIAFLASNLFFQVPIAVLGVLFTSKEKWTATTPYPLEKISQNFTIIGFRVGKILSVQL